MCFFLFFGPAVVRICQKLWIQNMNKTVSALLSISGVELLLHVGVLELFIAGFVMPYAISDDMAIYLSQVCSIPQGDSCCIDATLYFGCSAHSNHSRAVEDFRDLVRSVVLCGAISLISLLLREYYRHATDKTGTDICVTSTRMVQTYTVIILPISFLATAAHVSLFTEPVCDGKPAAADTAGLRMGPGPKLMFVGYVLAVANYVCGVFHTESHKKQTAAIEEEDEEPGVARLPGGSYEV
jgi:hypothetical protein